jgi:hypothetical protein
MTAITKESFLTAAINALSSYPTVAQHVQAGDPRVLAQLAAQATMLSMLSTQVDSSKFEPFVKSRDGTVLADAALKGILPLGRAAKATITIENKDAAGVEVTLGAQRRILDQKGRIYELDSAIAIPAGESRTVGVTQVRRRSITKIINDAKDFYSLPVSLSADDMHLNTLVVYRGTEEFTYAPDWFNVGPDENCYQVETDELRRMFVKFGKATVIGYGVKTGDEFTLEITECNGRIVDLAPGTDFNLEYIFAAEEVGVSLKLSSVQDEGAAPHTISELRVMARYPAIYDHNAVYLGEFEFLLRRYLSGIRFLSVWNEQIEEGVRGANVNNINCLFVSGLVAGMADATLQERISTLVKRADDSYRVKFVPAVLMPVPVQVTASVAISWDLATVESQIRALLLEYFGDGAINVSQGMGQPIKKSQINKLLREGIDALRDERAEFDVNVTLPGDDLPEHFLHITAASLTVNVSSAKYGVSLWNY